MPKKFESGYVLNVDSPLQTIQGGTIYRDKDTGEYRTGWYHCGCCGRDGFPSINTPTCTGCANKLNHGRELDSPVSVDEIKEYCDYFSKKGNHE